MTDKERADMIDKKGISPDNSHIWTVYLKPADGRDLTCLVDKISFVLHSSFKNATRTLPGPVFEVQETGWGQFDIPIKIYFVKESGEKPFTLTHTLKLFSAQQLTQTDLPPQVNYEPVLSEKYDEIIFNNPTEEFIKVYEKEYLSQPVKQHETFNQEKEQALVKQYQQALGHIQRQVAEHTKELKERRQSMKAQRK